MTSTTSSDWLQDVLDRSAESAGPAIAATFGRDDRRLTAAETRAFWRGTRMFAVSTVSPEGHPHIAPVHILFTEDDHLDMSIFEDSLRLKDLRENPRIAITAWGDDRTAVIAYGRTTEVPDTSREVNPGADPAMRRRVLTMRIALDRIYAMRPRPR